MVGASSASFEGRTVAAGDEIQSKADDLSTHGLRNRFATHGVLLSGLCLCSRMNAFYLASIKKRYSNKSSNV